MMEKKIYTKKKEKVIDFLIGFFLIPVFTGIFLGLIGALTTKLHRALSLLIDLSGVATVIILIIYFFRKRKYIGVGLLFSLVVVPLVALGTCLAIGAGIGLLNGFFKR